MRIKTERSSATTPDMRTSHNIANVEIEGRNGSWSPRYPDHSQIMGNGGKRKS